MSIEFLDKEALRYCEALSMLHMASFPPKEGWKEKDFADLLAISFHHLLINYDSEKKITGFLLFSVILDEAEILTFCVHPEHQNFGIGKALMAVFLEHLQKLDVKTIFLEVAEDNIAAIKLYDGFGFSKQGKRTNYYAHGASAWVMTKTV